MLEVSIVHELSTSAITLDLKIFMAKHGPLQFIYTDSLSKFFLVVNIVLEQQLMNIINISIVWVRRIKEILTPEYLR